MPVLKEILYKVSLIQTSGNMDAAIASLVFDSRKVGQGDAFVATRGTQVDGHDYIVKAIAAGASAVMIGGLFAGLSESPGRTILYQGRSFKVYRGMGSIGAMAKGSSERYRQAGQDNLLKLVPEGVEGRVPFKGPLADYVYQLVGGLRAGMGYCGTKNIDELRKDARFIKISPATVRENHPHDIAITQEAPNYSPEFPNAGDSN